MDARGRSCSSPSSQSNEEDMDLRRGPWTVEEDLILVNYIANHGEGRWNALARCAGLKRTGKSCRLRWLNYLRPDVRRGNITPEEQLLILELHSRWGNRWSKIAQHLPGRTDNEIKNYWRTRVQKQAKQLRCDVNSKQFKDAMRYLWMPRLVERIQAANARADGMATTQPSWPTGYDVCGAALQGNPAPGQAPESSFGNAVSSDSSAGLSVQDVSHDGSASESLADCYFPQQPQGSDYYSSSCGNTDFKPEWDTIVCPDAPLISPHGCYYYNQYDQNFDQYYKTHEEGASAPPPPPLPMETSSGGWLGGDLPNSSWNVDDMLFWRRQLCDDGLPL